MLALILLAAGVLSRILAHEPNVTPVIALAFFGGMFLKKEQALWVPLALMMISDVIIGLHGVILFTWGGIFLVSVIGRWQRERRGMGQVLGMSIVSALVFFAVSNFGVWLVMYPRTLEGFVQCYVMAVPFFRNTLMSTLAYSAVLFGLYKATARRVQGTSLAWITA